MANAPGGEETLLCESDWLGSRPCFYNVRTGRVGGRIDDVIDLADLEFDPEGLNDYLDFGFCVFEHTPLRDVRLLRHSARLLSGPQGLRVEYLDDPTCAWFEHSSTVDEVVEAAAAAVNGAAQRATGDVVVPTSGGLDSRFINLLLTDRSRVRAFTYGLSDRPERSNEVVKAAELAQRLGFRWETVPLGDFHRRFDDWDELFGPAMHAHGMYQMEFYGEVAARVAPGSVVISGACGDTLAGGDDRIVSELPILDRPDDMLAWFRWAPMCADSAASLLPSSRERWRAQIDADPRLRTEFRPRVVFLIRQQALFYSYLAAVPEAAGLPCATPFVETEVARLLLTLPWELRNRRLWQRELFRRRGIDLEFADLPSDWRNTLNLRALRRVPPPPLDVELLREIVKPDYVRWVNRNVGRRGLPWEAMVRLGWTRGFRKAVAALQAAGVTEQRSPAYFAYLTLRPLETLLRRRDRARAGLAGGASGRPRFPHRAHRGRTGLTGAGPV